MEDIMAKLQVDGMHCGHCKKRVEDAVLNIPGIKSARADLAKKELVYEEDSSMLPARDAVIKTIKDLGYEPVLDA